MHIRHLEHVRSTRNNSGTPRIAGTIAVVENENGYHVAVTQVHLNDMGSKKEGRRIAFSRLLGTLVGMNCGKNDHLTLTNATLKEALDFVEHHSRYLNRS